MNIGDYVRTKYGIIGKVVKEETFMNDINIFLDNNKGNITLSTKDGMFKVNRKKDIVKSSPNIIDLIEVGDLMFIDISPEYAPDYYEGIVVPRIAETLHEGQNYYDKFKSGECVLIGIVTKEQIESMVYKL